MTKVSVIIPCYNSERTIRETLESVLAQTHKDIEVIVVDDGSNDASKDVILAFGDQVHYLYIEHSGRSSVARNVGIRAANGEYIAFVDSDDLWLPEKLEKQMQIMKEQQKFWCYCACLYFRDSDKKIIGRYSQLVHPARVGWIGKDLLMGNRIPSPTAIIHRDLLYKAGLYDESMRSREDWDLWLRIAMLASVAYLPEVLAKYRVHNRSKTYGIDPQLSYENHITVVKKIIAQYPQELMPLRNHTLAYYAARFSRSHWLAGNIDPAKALINRALSYEPRQWKYHILKMSYCLPYGLVQSVMKFRNKIRDVFR